MIGYIRRVMSSKQWCNSIISYSFLQIHSIETEAVLVCVCGMKPGIQVHPEAS